MKLGSWEARRLGGGRHGVPMIHRVCTILLTLAIGLLAAPLLRGVQLALVTVSDPMRKRARNNGIWNET